MHGRAMAIALAIATAGCTLTPSDEPATAPAVHAQAADDSASSLTSVESCEALDALLRPRLIAAMHAQLQATRQRITSFARCAHNAGMDVPRAATPSAAPTVGGARPMPGPPNASSAPSAVSSTNNQVTGVEEADLVKAVGRYLYVVGRGTLHVLEAWPASGTREVARVAFAGTPRDLLVDGDRALVYSAVGGSGRACTYGYDCDFVGDGSRTHLTVLDVREPGQPRVVRELELSGSLIAARRIGGTVHTVVADREPMLPFSQLPPILASSCAGTQPSAELDAAFAAMAKKNEELILAADLSKLLPQLSDTAAPNAGPACGGYVAPREPSGASFLSVVSLELAHQTPPTRTTLIGRPGAVYVSSESLYVAARDDAARGPETSTVHRFRVGDAPALTRYEASGVVPGHPLNQFAMDEHAGHLRIATTSGRVPDPRTESTLSVLAQRDAKLEVVGQVGQIAPGEDIRSVRFAGERGYLVTFKKTDPLFVLGLADPRAPRVLGELKIPGFSTYMHPLDADHLLTIGYDSEEGNAQGSFAYFQGVLLQIFDVSDPARPRQRHKTVIGTRGSSSEALTNHLAFNYFADKRLLSVPMTICDGGRAGSFGTTMRFSGLMLFDVDLARGIVERGRVAHPPLDGQGYRDASCSNWWTNATSNVKRSVFMDDYVYSIATDVVRVQALGELGRDVATVPLIPLEPRASAPMSGGTAR